MNIHFEVVEVNLDFDSKMFLQRSGNVYLGNVLRFPIIFDAEFFSDLFRGGYHLTRNSQSHILHLGFMPTTMFQKKIIHTKAKHCQRHNRPRLLSP